MTAVGSPAPSGPVPRGLPGPRAGHGPLLMGVVNVTPDSFSDGGRYADVDAAVAHGRDLLAQGADLLDVGGESTRPGATRPLVAEELDRVVPVIAELVAAGAVVSVDTMRAEVARAALEAGARVVNDVSGGLADPEVLRVVADAGATYVAMHWRAHSTHMQDFATYDRPGGVVGAVVDELGRRVDAALAAGVDARDLVLDPGIGFAKTGEHNWVLLRSLGEPGAGPLGALGHPLLVGVSRKAFLGHLLARPGRPDLPDGSREAAAPRPVTGREHATAALTLHLADAGAWCVRVHDVAASADVLAVRAALVDPSGAPAPVPATPTDRRIP